MHKMKQNSDKNNNKNQCQICIPSVQFTVKKKNIQMKPNYFQVLNLMFLVAEQKIK